MLEKCVKAFLTKVGLGGGWGMLEKRFYTFLTRVGRYAGNTLFHVSNRGRVGRTSVASLMQG